MIKNNLYILRLLSTIIFSFYFCCYSQDYHKRDSLIKVAKENIDTIKIKALNSLGTFYMNVDFDSSLLYSKQALEYAVKINFKKGQGHAYSNIGLVLNKKGNYTEALKNYFKCVIIRDDLHDQKGLCIAYSRIADVYLNSKKTNLAIEYERKALNIALETDNQQSIAGSYNNLGNIYLELKNLDTSLAYYKKAFFIKQKLNNIVSLANTISNISNIYLSKENYKEALNYSLQSLKIFEENGINDQLSHNYHNLGTIYTQMRDFEKATHYLNKSLTLNLRQGSEYDLSEDYIQFVFLNEKQKNFELALEYFRKYSDLKDSIFSQDSNTQLAEMETKYQTEKKETENKLLQTQNDLSLKTIKEQQLTTYFIIGGLVIVSFFAFFIFKGLKKQRKANTIIALQKREVEKQKELVEEHQKEILDSIHYAKRIQNTLLAHHEFLDENIPNNFVLFKPKDIVSGDFYWAAKQGSKFYLAICDSTGHGVPGAFMSLLNIGFLSEAINEKNILEPNNILEHVRQRLTASVSKDGQKDGFDGILLCIDKESNIITYAAAHNAPILISNNEFQELAKDKMPVGVGERKEDFKLYTINLNKGDMLYLYTDGYADQFGGPKGKKLKYKVLNELLLKNSSLSMNEQSDILLLEFENWRGNLEQVDDVCIVGIKL